MVGRFVVAQASVRVFAAGTPNAWFSSKVASPSFAVTALESNSATIYIVASNSPGVAAATKTRVTKLGIPLTPRQTFTFTGIPLGSGAYRDIAAGTLYVYVDANKDNDRALITYMKQF